MATEEQSDVAGAASGVGKNRVAIANAVAPAKGDANGAMTVTESTTESDNANLAAGTISSTATTTHGKDSDSRSRAPQLHPFFAARRKSTGALNGEVQAPERRVCDEGDEVGSGAAVDEGNVLGSGAGVDNVAIVDSVAAVDDGNATTTRATSPAFNADDSSRRTSARLLKRQSLVADSSSCSPADAELLPAEVLSVPKSMHPFFSKKARLSLDEGRKGRARQKTAEELAAEAAALAAHNAAQAAAALEERQRKLVEDRIVSQRLATALTAGDVACKGGKGKKRQSGVRQDAVPSQPQQQHTFFALTQSRIASGRESIAAFSSIPGKLSDALTSSHTSLLDPLLPCAEAQHIGWEMRNSWSPLSTYARRGQRAANDNANDGLSPWRYRLAETELTPARTSLPQFLKHSHEDKQRAVRDKFPSFIDHPAIRHVLSVSEWTTTTTPACLLDKYRPRKADDLLIAPDSRSSVIEIREWLSSYLQESSTTATTMTTSTATSGDETCDESDSDASSAFIDDSEDADYDPDFKRSKPLAKKPRQLASQKRRKRKHADHAHAAVLLHSQTASVKTSLVYALAAELGFNVVEVNEGMARSGAELMELIGESTQSHQLGRHSTPVMGTVKQWNTKENSKSKSTAPASTASRTSLLLVESVDVLFPQHDVQFWKTMMKLVMTSRRPILMTCSDLDLLPVRLLDDNKDNIKAYHIPAIDDEIAVACLSAVCANEGFTVDLDAVASIRGEARSLRQNLLQLDIALRTSDNSEQSHVAAEMHSTVHPAQDIHTLSRVADSASYADAWILPPCISYHDEPHIEPAKQDAGVAYRDEYRDYVMDVLCEAEKEPGRMMSYTERGLSEQLHCAYLRDPLSMGVVQRAREEWSASPRPELLDAVITPAECTVRPRALYTEYYPTLRHVLHHTHVVLAEQKLASSLMAGANEAPCDGANSHRRSRRLIVAESTLPTLYFGHLPEHRERQLLNDLPPAYSM